jgi:hypothetical protein
VGRAAWRYPVGAGVPRQTRNFWPLQPDAGRMPANGMVRPCSLHCQRVDAGRGYEGAPPCPTNQLRSRRGGHRHRQELIPRCRPRSARRDRAAAEMVPRPSRGTTCQLAPVPDRHGGDNKSSSIKSLRTCSASRSGHQPCVVTLRLQPAAQVMRADAGLRRSAAPGPWLAGLKSVPHFGWS